MSNPSPPPRRQPITIRHADGRTETVPHDHFNPKRRAKPTRKQMLYLRRLALEAGVMTPSPQTRREAQSAIDRLKNRRV